MKWFVVRTAPGQHHKALTEFAEAGIPAYCPRMKKETRHHQTKKWIMREYPLFTGYCFVRLTDGDFDRLHAFDYTLSILGSQIGPLPIPDSEVEDLQQAEARGDFDELRPPPMAALKPRSRVYIQSGPLAGHYALVTKARGKKIVRAIVESFSEMREIDIDIAKLKLVA